MNWDWILVLIIVVVIIIVTKRKGHFWKTKSGEKISFKQFLGRWKKGIEGINALQQTKMQLMGIWITITGILSGIVVNALIRMENIWWWVEIILVGSLIVTGAQVLGIYQKYVSLKTIQKAMDDLEKEKENE